jgi:transposase-like protein
MTKANQTIKHAQMDDTTFSVPCPDCGQNNLKKSSFISAMEEFRCKHCGSIIALQELKKAV